MACNGSPPIAAAGVRPVPARVESFRIAMPELGGRERTIRVHLPKGYEAGDTRYPVLYLQDGQNLFEHGAYGDWLADETLDALVDAHRSAGVIAVGIDNSEHRWEEYGPWVNPRMHRWIDPSWGRAAQGGAGEQYVRFLVETLKPEIDRRYRTRPDRAHTGIGGSSMGGVISLYAGLTRPDVFSKVMAMSTAVWYAEGDGPWLSHNRLLALVRQGTVPEGVRFYLDVGADERSRDADPDVTDDQGNPVSYPRAYVEGTEAVAAALRLRGVPPSNVKLVIEPGATHHESAWARRFGDAVVWLYDFPPSP